MRSVMIDGVQYVPKVEGKIGIAITTHNRPKVLEDALKNQLKYLPDGAHIVVVDDGSTVPAQVQEGVALIRHDKSKGIARAKNACIAALIDAGCDHLFLFDDDAWPLQDGWWRPYVYSSEPHLLYGWGDYAFKTDDLVGYTWPKGCMLYVERKVIDRVGGYDPVFGKWGCEHLNFSDRIHNAGFTTCRYQDIPGSERLFKAMDRGQEFASSVPLAQRDVNTKAALDNRYSDEYIDYRSDVKRPKVSLSVCIPSVHTRYNTFAPKIQEQVFKQYNELPVSDQRRVEVLIFTDTKSRSVGAKRNEMVRLAKGEYVAFVDDDDRLSPDYLSSLLAATASAADVITFDVSVSLNGAAAKICRYSLKYEKDENTATEYHRLPNHIMATRRELMWKEPFPDQSKLEDFDYAKRLRPHLKTEHHVDKVLYHYDYSDDTTETQIKMERYNKDLGEIARKPNVDVVMLSNSPTPELRAMTQAAIDTCIAGAGSSKVNVIVVEQADGVRYRDAVTIKRTGKFNYNACCNFGASTGNAPWILFANNDLVFEHNWLQPLLDARHELVSPLNPGDSRQTGVVRNEIGIINGRNLSGWCYMMSRKLWEKIGGLDDCVSYWCSDDVVIEQAKANGVKPMLVPTSRVRHLVSKTGGSAPTDDMSWDNVQIFEKKYGIKKFPGDARYNDYKRRKGIPL